MVLCYTMMQAPLLNKEKGTMDGEERECFRIVPFMFPT